MREFEYEIKCVFCILCHIFIHNQQLMLGKHQISKLVVTFRLFFAHKSFEFQYANPLGDDTICIVVHNRFFLRLECR